MYGHRFTKVYEFAINRRRPSPSQQVEFLCAFIRLYYAGDDQALFRAIGESGRSRTAIGNDQ